MNHFKISKYISFTLLILSIPSAFAKPSGFIPIFHLKEIVGPYPALGTIESDEDFEVLMKYQQTRTTEECAEAATEEKGTLSNLFGGVSGPLTTKEVKHFSFLIKRGMIASTIDHSIAKMIYKRPRQFLTHPEIKPCIKLPNSTSYPSGHSTISRVYARILSVMYPDRAAAFMVRADEIAMHRVLGGVHHPSDTAAGKRLGDAIARRLLNTNSF